MQQRKWHGRSLPRLPMLLLTAFLLVLVGNLVFAGPSKAYAQSSNTLTFAPSGELLARITVQISGTASCTLPADATIEGIGLSVEVTQASGREIVQGVGGASLAMTCDGMAYPFEVFVTPPAGSAPFHGGAAIVSGTLSVIWIDAVGFFHEDRLSTDPVVIKITG